MRRQRRPFNEAWLTDYLIAARRLSPLCSLCQRRLLTEIKAWEFGGATRAALIYRLCDECRALSMLTGAFEEFRRECQRQDSGK